MKARLAKQAPTCAALRSLPSARKLASSCDKRLPPDGMCKGILLRCSCAEGTSFYQKTDRYRIILALSKSMYIYCLVGHREDVSLDNDGLVFVLLKGGFSARHTLMLLACLKWLRSDVMSACLTVQG